MRIVRIVSRALGWLVVIGSCCAAATAAGPAIDMKDVAMTTDGRLQGVVVDSTGAGMSGIAVAMRLHNQEVASVTTDKDGRFAVEGLKGGVYQVAAPQDVADYRVWLADAAPPTAGDRVVLRQNASNPQTAATPASMGENPPSPSAPIYRGQNTPRGGLMRPLLIGTAIATAIAVPVTLANQKKPHSP